LFQYPIREIKTSPTKPAAGKAQDGRDNSHSATHAHQRRGIHHGHDGTPKTNNANSDQLVEASDGKTFPVYNPATREISAHGMYLSLSDPSRGR
jgi:hypothetical protein